MARDSTLSGFQTLEACPCYRLVDCIENDNKNYNHDLIEDFIKNDNQQ